MSFPESAYFYLPSAITSRLAHMPSFLYRCWDLNSGAHANEASTSPTELSSQYSLQSCWSINSLGLVKIKCTQCLNTRLLSVYVLKLMFDIEIGAWYQRTHTGLSENERVICKYRNSKVLKQTNRMFRNSYPYSQWVVE